MVVRWRHLMPLALVVGLAGSMAAAAGTGIGWLAWMIAGPYLAANCIASAQNAWKQRSMKLGLQLPVVFASLHLAYGVGSLWGCARWMAICIKRKARQ
jgi:succinoglycan biosynthesis protein ExoA